MESGSLYPPVFLVDNSDRARRVYYNYEQDKFFVQYQNGQEEKLEKRPLLALPFFIILLQRVDVFLLEQQPPTRLLIAEIVMLAVILLTPLLVRLYFRLWREKHRNFAESLVEIFYLADEQEKKNVRRLYRTQLLLLLGGALLVVVNAIAFFVTQETFFGFFYISGYPLLYLAAVGISPLKKRKFMKRYGIL